MQFFVRRVQVVVGQTDAHHDRFDPQEVLKQRDHRYAAAFAGKRRFYAEGAFQRALQGEASAAASQKAEGKPRKVNRGLIKTSNKGIS